MNSLSEFAAGIAYQSFDIATSVISPKRVSGAESAKGTRSFFPPSPVVSLTSEYHSPGSSLGNLGKGYVVDRFCSICLVRLADFPG